MTEAQTASREKRRLLRDELQKLLKNKYDRAKRKGVLQYHFVFPDNISFLRMHKPSKFGDDLTDIRDDFKEVNETKKAIRGFTQGRTAHGFRNTFPLFNKKGEHIGVVEISFSSDSFQWYLNHISQIHTHFLVDRALFEAKAWKRDDLVLKYSQSAESPDYMITLGDMHSEEKCVIENREKLKDFREEIDSRMLKGEMFGFYLDHLDHVDVLSFLPIKNLQKETVAWLVSYEKNQFILMTLKNMMNMRVGGFLFSLILIYFIIQQLRARASINKKHKLLDNILNATDNIMFITDFTEVSFSNDRFKHLFNIKETGEFNEQVKEDVFSVFEKTDGYLHTGLLKESEEPIDLIKRTPEDERIVSILDRHFDTKAFKISISITHSDSDYLVTLSDITKLKQKHELTEKKAYIDGLTGVYNRSKFDEILSEEIIKTKESEQPFSMAILDIDKFKDFNDRHGHLIGDEVLIMMAKSVNSNVRDTDTFARWGGEEFAILFTNTTVEHAKNVSQKLKDKIEKLEHDIAGNITVSFGVTQYREGDTVQSLFKRCDEALYLAKENGRNRVEVL